MKNTSKTVVITLLVCLVMLLTVAQAQPDPIFDPPPRDPGGISPERLEMTARLTALEQAPLTEYDRQIVIIESDLYCRDMGETNFQLQDPASVASRPAIAPQRSSANRGRPEAGQSAPSANTQLFLDDFEQGFPETENWYIVDNDPDGPFDVLWDDVDCVSISGSRSVWCAGGSWVSPCTIYPINGDPWMTVSNIDVGEYDDIVLSFETMYNLATNDRLEIWVEFDFDDPQKVMTCAGSSSGWDTKTINIQALNKDWFSMQFACEFNNGVYDEQGIYFDDIKVDGVPPPRPNLKPTTPMGYSGPLTVSHTPSSMQTDEKLYAGQTAFINWAVKNDATVAAPTFETEIYIDGVYVGGSVTLGLDGGGVDDYVYNLEHTFSSGAHTVSMAIDVDQEVDEEKEDDNTYSRSFQFNVSAANIAFVHPPGWSGPVVLTNDPNSRQQVAALYADRPVYLHYAVQNTGSDPIPSSFENQVLIDGSPIGQYPVVGGFSPGEMHLEEAIPMTLGEGLHNVEVLADINGDIGEPNEDDNDASVTCTWTQQMLTVRGRFEFQRPLLDGLGREYLYGDHILVRMYRYDGQTGPTGDELGETHTDEDGYFTFDPVVNADPDGLPLDIVVYFISATDLSDIQCRADLNSPLESRFIQRGPYPDCADDELNTGITQAPYAESMPFYVAQVLRDNCAVWNSLRPGRSVESVVAVLGYPNENRYNASDGTIELDDGYSTGNASPGGFQRLLISRLFAEKVMYENDLFERDPSARWYVQPYDRPHYASYAGFADVWAVYEGLANDYFITDPVYQEFSNSWDNNTTYNLETGEYSITGSGEGSLNAMGVYYGPSSACVLWDMLDAEVDDYSGPDDWGLTRLPHQSDEVVDDIDVSMDEFLSLAFDKNSDYDLHHPPGSIMDVLAWWYWREPWPNTDLLEDVFYEHGIDVFDCLEPGDFNGDGIGPNLVDIMDMIQWLYRNGPPPPFINQSDANGDCTPNVLDITSLIAFLYKDGAAPVCGCMTELPVYGLLGNEPLASETAELIVAVSGGTSTLQLNSPISLDALELEFGCGETATMQSLVANLDLLGSETEADRRVALVSLNGSGDIDPGLQDVVSVSDVITPVSAYGVNADNEKVEMSIVQYLCGDANNDGLVNILDIGYINAYLHSGGPEPAVPSAGDPNGDCVVNPLDATYLIAFLYQSGDAPLPGCVTTVAAGGARVPESAVLTSDSEVLVTVNSYYDNGSTTLEVSSSADLLALELEVACDNKAAIAHESRELQLYTGHSDDLTKVALMDVAGSAYIAAGQTIVVSVTGEADVTSAIAADMTGQPVQVNLSAASGVLPTETALHNCYPNPFNPSTEIKFSLPEGCRAKLDVLNVLGQRVETLVDGHLEAGEHSSVWEASRFASGIYFYRLTADEFVETKKMVLLK